MAEPDISTTYFDPRRRIHWDTVEQQRDLSEDIKRLRRQLAEVSDPQLRARLEDKIQELRRQTMLLDEGAEHQGSHVRESTATLARAQQSLGQLDPNIGPAQYGVDEAAVRQAQAAAQAAAQGMGQYSAFRGDQRWLAGHLRDAVEGRGPSVAESTLDRGLDAGMRQNTAMALTGSTNPLLARRQAMQQNQFMVQQGAMDAGLLRAQEIAQNRALLAGVSESGRMGDLARNQAAYGALAQQAGLTLEQQLAMNAARNEAALTNAGLAIDMSSRNVGLQNAHEQQRRQNIMSGVGMGIEAAGAAGSMGMSAAMSGKGGKK